MSPTSIAFSVLMSLAAGLMIWALRALLERRAEQKLESRVKGDVRLRGMQYHLDELALVWQANPCRVHPRDQARHQERHGRAGASAAWWRIDMRRALVHLESNLPGESSLPDPALAAEIRGLSQLADDRIKALDQTSSANLRELEEVARSAAIFVGGKGNFVLACYEDALRRHLRDERKRPAA